MVNNVVQPKYSYKLWGNKEKCDCVEFTFDNTRWFTSKGKLIVTVIVLVLSVIIGCRLVEEGSPKLKYCLYLLMVILILFVLKVIFCVRKETLYVIPPIGVQFITSYVMGQDSVMFVPWHSLKNFLIVEVIVGQQIFFYLALQNKTNDKDGLVILFQNTRPRLSYLEEIYRIIVQHSPS